VRSIVARFVGVCWVTVAMTSVATSCASSEEDGVFAEEDASGGTDAGIDSSVGGSGGISSGGSSGSATGGTGGVSTGGSAGASAGGSSGFGGAGGASGFGGAGGATGGTGGTGSCNPAFCPNTGSGAPCCVTPNGPCGSDNGLGCQQNPGPDI
jgi:hypothetical protein